MVFSNNICRKDTEKTNFLRQLLDGKRVMSLDEAQTRANLLGLSTLMPPFVVVAIAPDYSVVKYSEKDKLIYEVESYADKLLDEFGYDGASVTDSACCVLSLLSLKNKTTNSTELDEVFATVHHKIQMHFQLDLFIGIGGIVDSLNMVNISSADAKEMLAYKYQYSTRGVINISNILRFSHARYVGNQSSVEQVIGCFQDGDLGKMAARLDDLIEQVRNRPGVSKTSIRRTMIDLLIRVLNIASNADVDVDEVLEGRDPYRWILEQGHTEVQREWLLEVCSKLLVKMRENQHGEAGVLLKQACKYVDDNLHRNDLSLLQVSSHVGLSGAYFSQLFKQETGEGFSAYITRNRIERAKVMLRETDLKVEDIALQNGFSSANYFSTVFKNNVGQTPAEYRRNCYFCETIKRI